MRQPRGSASVDQVALAALIALLALAAIAALAAAPLGGAGRDLAAALARKLRCASALPGPCWRDPLTEAYGRPLAGLVRALAPAPAALAGPSGAPLWPVDFRRCRRESCARGGAGGLTAAGRRTTAFTSVEDRRRTGAGVTVTYWLYRPGLGWSRVTRTSGAAEVTARAATPLPESDDPRLVPLETLAGRNHERFAAGEDPPWRWLVATRYQ